MRKVKGIGEDEMIAVFLYSELGSKRFRSNVPRALEQQAVEARLICYGRYCTRSTTTGLSYRAGPAPRRMRPNGFALGSRFSINPTQRSGAPLLR